MTRKRKKIDPLVAMAAANPISTAALAVELEEGDLERARERAVALEPTSSPPAPASGRVATGRRVALGLAFAAAATLGALLAFGGLLGGAGGVRPEFAAAAIRVAEANPRLLVTAPGWEIVRADEFEPDSGELLFSDGSRRFEIHWYPARLYEAYLDDRADVSAPEPGTLLGRGATTVEYSRDEFATMLAPQGDVFIETRGRLGSRDGYEEILHSLRPVDVETWLAAMPPTTVRPEARSKAVEEMLRGIPLPPGFSAAMLRGGDSISDEGSLAVKVGNAVACGWVESWIAARASGDEAAARRAVEAMASSADWPIVRETRVPWFSNYRIVTRQMREGRLDRGYAGYEVRADGRTFGFGPAWKLALGCEGTYRREIDALPRHPDPAR
ncbi:MAG TPA: hypothetical protein VGV34_04515 [Solirubrobacterales bacterium]|nr:hypothetical protein [Solirubrobacterales bacterium]